MFLHNLLYPLYTFNAYNKAVLHEHGNNGTGFTGQMNWAREQLYRKLLKEYLTKDVTATYVASGRTNWSSYCCGWCSRCLPRRSLPAPNRAEGVRGWPRSHHPLSAVVRCPLGSCRRSPACSSDLLHRPSTPRGPYTAPVATHSEYCCKTNQLPQFNAFDKSPINVLYKSPDT